jgi:uncharacterized membrane protein YkvA (DUF1232 family)
MTETNSPDEELAVVLREDAGDGGLIPRDRAQRFYDRIRQNISRYLDKHGGAVEKGGEYLMLVPDMFMLLWRLVNDSRVGAKHKMLLGSGIAYYLFPFDVIPEGFIGPIGFLDDLVLGVYMLNSLLTDTDPQILREHWSGEEDVLATIRKVLDSADRLVGSEVMGRFKKMGK